jgi:hypothetical protein
MRVKECTWQLLINKEYNQINSVPVERDCQKEADKIIMSLKLSFVPTKQQQHPQQL